MPGPSLKLLNNVISWAIFLSANSHTGDAGGDAFPAFGAMHFIDSVDSPSKLSDPNKVRVKPLVGVMGWGK